MKRVISTIIIAIASLPLALAQTSLKQSTDAQPALQKECVSRTFVQPPTKYARAVDSARRAICGQLVPRVPGVQVAVAVEGRLVWSEAFGYADIERRVPVVATTMFRIGSVSKPLTADAVALLVQEGKLDFDAPVQRYVPTFPSKPWPITPRELAGHISGIRGYINKWAGGGYLSTAEDLVRFSSAHLKPDRLTPASLDLLFTSMRTRDGKETGYGVGWYIGRDERGHRVVSHAGSAVGGSAILS